MKLSVLIGFLSLLPLHMSFAQISHEEIKHHQERLRILVETITSGDVFLASGAGNGGDQVTVKFVATARSLLKILQDQPPIGVNLQEYERVLNDYPNLVVAVAGPLFDKYGLQREALNFPGTSSRRPLILLDKEAWERMDREFLDTRTLVGHEMFEVIGHSEEHVKAVSSKLKQILDGYKVLARDLRTGNFEYRLEIGENELLSQFHYGRTLRVSKERFDVCLLHSEARQAQGGDVEVKLSLEGRNQATSHQGTPLYESKVYYRPLGREVKVQDYPGYREQTIHVLGVMEQLVGGGICPQNVLAHYQATYLKELREIPLEISFKYGTVSLQESFSICLMSKKSQQLADGSILLRLYLNGIDGQREKVLYSQTFTFTPSRPMALGEIPEFQREREHFLEVFRQLAQYNVCSHSSYLVFRNQ